MQTLTSYAAGEKNDHYSCVCLSRGSRLHAQLTADGLIAAACRSFWHGGKEKQQTEKVTWLQRRSFGPCGGVFVGQKHDVALQSLANTSEAFLLA